MSKQAFGGEVGLIVERVDDSAALSKQNTVRRCVVRPEEHIDVKAEYLRQIGIDNAAMARDHNRFARVGYESRFDRPTYATTKVE